MSAIKISDYNINIDANNVNYASSAGYAELTGPHNHNAIQIVDLNANVSSIVSSFKASSDAFGLVKIGEGINVSSGVISIDVNSFNGNENAVVHFDAMPDPESSVDQVAIYTGETDSSYAKGHVYKKEQSNTEDTLTITVDNNDYSDIAGTYHITSSKTITGGYYDEDDNWIEVTITDIPIFENENNCILECFYDSEVWGTYWNFSFNDNNFRQAAFQIPDNNDNDQNVESLINDISDSYESTGQQYVGISITSIKSSGSSSTIWNDITPDEGGLNRIITSSNVTAQNGNWYLCNANVTITLPVSPNQGDVVRVSSISSANNISIVPSGTDTIENQVGFVIDASNSSVELMYNGSMWVVSEVVVKGLKSSNYTRSSVPIGTIFYHISSTPPEGAFLLNGQIIYNCSILYPEFYQYITSNNNIRKITTSVYEGELTSTGICGGFVVDTENGSIRLPNISNGFIEGSNGSNIGSTINDGLPNITGYTNPQINISAESSTGTSVGTPSGAFYRTVIGDGYYFSNQGTRSDGAYGLVLDASRSSAVYGRSNTVQPKSVFYSVCIQVFNTVTNISTQESAQLATELQSKVGINADNFTAAGKNNMLNYTFDLDWTNAFTIPAMRTTYTADRAGIVCVGGDFTANTTARLDIFVFPPIYPGINMSYASVINVQNPSAIRGNYVWAIVPQNCRYAVDYQNLDTLYRCVFIPFKNSISSNS